MCRDKGLDAEVADLFTYPPLQAAGEFDGIFASQLVEHLEPARLPEMIRLCAASLRRGGVLAIETPNPDCLAIFATYFYLDPTHTRPVPRQLLEFYMEESGIGSIEVHEISPAVESIPEISGITRSAPQALFRRAGLRNRGPQAIATGTRCKMVSALASLLGGRPTVGLQILDLRIGVRIPASQPTSPGKLKPC